MRGILTRLHRYTGLAIAIFIALAGLSGSLIVFYHELDRALNPELFHAPGVGAALSPNALAARVERQLPGARTTLVSLSVPTGHASEMWVEPKSGTLAYDQVFADPVTGRVLGKRAWGEFAFSRAAVMPVIYLFHYTLKLPGIWGIYLMGIVGCLWTIDCFVAFALTLPRGAPFWKKWQTSWRIKSGASAFRLHFDLHRAGGLWLWTILIVLATSGVAMNLTEQVFRPIVGLFTTLSPSLSEVGAARMRETIGPARLSFDEAVARAAQEVHGKKFVPRYVFRQTAYRTFGVGFGAAGSDGMDSWGLSYLYFDDRSGAVVLRQMAGEGRAGDLYAGAQFQLHSGRILGWPGRILICLTGLAVTMLSITGVIIWFRKLRARDARLHNMAAHSGRGAP